MNTPLGFIAITLLVIYMFMFLAGCVGYWQEGRKIGAFNNGLKIVLFTFGLGILTCRLCSKLASLSNGKLYNFMFGDFTIKPKYKPGDILYKDYSLAIRREITIKMIDYRRLRYLTADSDDSTHWDYWDIRSLDEEPGFKLHTEKVVRAKYDKELKGILDE